MEPQSEGCMDRDIEHSEIDGRRARSLTMYTTIVALGATLAILILLATRGDEPKSGEQRTGLTSTDGAGGGSAGRDEHEELVARLREAEAAQSLGEICKEHCSCLCYSRRTDDRVEPITVCRLNQDACHALEKKIESKPASSTSGRAIGESVSAACRKVDMREVNRRNEVSRSEWSPSKRNGGELFGVFYPGQCLLN